MITKLKAIIFASFALIPLACNAGYTTMTIEGVKQADGVWTAAGVMDSMGFVRTTGAVSVMGTTRNLPVSMLADIPLSSALVKGAAHAAGPIALAATAYDLYSFFTSNGISAEGNQWVIPSYNSDPNVVHGNYVSESTSQTACSSSSPSATFDCLYANDTNWKRFKAGDTKYSFSCTMASNGATVTCALKYLTGTQIQRTFNYLVCNGQSYTSCIPFPPATPSDFNKLPQLPIPLIISGFTKLPSLAGKPTPIKSTDFVPFSEWLGSPYFKDGNWYRDRMDISPCPTASQPTRVCVDIGPQKFEGATNPQTVPSQATGTATGSTPKENADFCKKNPQSIACAELGELEDENLEVDERPVDVSYTPWGSSNAQCPADKVIPLWDSQSIALSYSPICQFASLLRPLVIALAFVAAGFIVAGITRKGGGDA